MPGMTEDDHKRIYYSAIWPNQLFSLHPDYLMLHWVMPLAPGRTLVRCEWYFDPREMAKPDFNPSEAIEFWDLTNRQDWHVCELQQQGTKSRVHGRPVLLDGEQRPWVRSDGGGPLRQRRRRYAPGTRLQAGEQRGHQGARQARCSGRRRCRLTPSVAASHLEDVAPGAELGAVTFGEAAIDVLHLSGDV